MTRSRISDRSLLVISFACAFGTAAVGGLLFYVANRPVVAKSQTVRPRVGRPRRSVQQPAQSVSPFSFRVPRALGGSVLPLFTGTITGNSFSGIAVRVTNNTGMTISRVEFQVIRMASGREVPISSEDFGRSPAGGIENGETMDWEFYRDRSELPKSIFANSYIVFKATALYDAKGVLIEQVKDSH